ncbi:MAG: hypothetical protein HY289_07140 [Planctomycetes bacterium]|nr:hypothetical protein [Planctomycetota bacterium]
MEIIRIEDYDPKKHGIPLGELTPEQLKEAYALARAAFTVDDLQKFTEIEEETPMEDFLKELEQAQQMHDRKSP